MSALSAAAADEDADEIQALRKRVAELQSKLAAVSAGGVGPQPDHCEQNLNMASANPSTAAEFLAACRDDAENPTNIDSPMNACMYQAACKRWRDQATAEESSVLQGEPVAWWNPVKDTASTDPVHRHNPGCQPFYTRQTAAIPHGWKLVPVDPIPGMHLFLIGKSPSERLDHWKSLLLEATRQPPQADTGIPASEQPAQWVGLTGKERSEVIDRSHGRFELSENIESLLRKKNASAQVRQPLTDEQINAMWQQSCREHFSGLQREIHLARSVEAAHGIK